MLKRAVFWMIAVVMLVAGSHVLADDEKPSARIVIDETQVMALIGGTLGGGTLLLEDDSYSFKTAGLSLGASIGIKNIHITGNVYHLNKVKDFPGTYLVTEAGATVGKGTSDLRLKNKHGVTMHLKSSTKGLALSIAAEGLTITMD